VLKPDISTEGESNEAKNLEGQVSVTCTCNNWLQVFFLGGGGGLSLPSFCNYYIFIVIYGVAKSVDHDDDDDDVIVVPLVSKYSPLLK